MKLEEICVCIYRLKSCHRPALRHQGFKNRQSTLAAIPMVEGLSQQNFIKQGDQMNQHFRSL